MPTISGRVVVLAVALFVSGLMAMITLSINSSLNAGQIPQQASGEDVDFETQIIPLIAKRCLRCHGPDDQQADFRIDDRETAFYYIEPGDSENSDWYERLITDDEELMMPPPDEGGPLPADEIALFQSWIDQGANWPEDAKIEPPPPEVVEEVKEQVQQQQQLADQQANTGQLVWEITGLLHPVAIHFPIAMLIGGAFFAIFGFRGESPLSDAAYYCLWLGALGAVFAAVSGWSFGFEKSYNNWQDFDWGETINRHRWGGVLVAALAMLLAITAAISRKRDPYGTGAIWKLGLVLLAGLVGYIGHQGGEMTHDGLHEKLMNKSQIVYENIAGQTEATRKEKERQSQEAEKLNQAEGNEENGNEENGNEENGNESEAQEGSARTSDDQSANN